MANLSRCHTRAKEEKVDRLQWEGSDHLERRRERVGGGGGGGERRGVKVAQVCPLCQHAPTATQVYCLRQPWEKEMEQERWKIGLAVRLWCSRWFGVAAKKERKRGEGGRGSVEAGATGPLIWFWRWPAETRCVPPSVCLVVVNMFKMIKLKINK